MPKGRHAAHKKQSQHRTVAESPQETAASFVEIGHHRQGSGLDTGAASPALTCPQLVVLAFNNKSTQHAALARIEAFYESAEQRSAYLSLDAAKAARLCPNYEAFNVPMAAVRAWLLAMSTALPSKEETESDKSKEGSPEAKDGRRFWTLHCNVEERQLLHYLESLGCLEEDPVQTGNAPIYLVSVLAAKVSDSLPHEQLHFLYHVSADYRAATHEQYEYELSSKARHIIETDLGMRKYAPHVFCDEFQAYVSLDAGEFGAKTRSECLPIRAQLLRVQRRVWSALSSEAGSGNLMPGAAEKVHDCEMSVTEGI